MDVSKEARLKALTEEIAALLYEETDPEAVKTLEGIEKAVRGHLLEHVGPAIGNFSSVNGAMIKRSTDTNAVLMPTFERMSA